MARDVFITHDGIQYISMIPTDDEYQVMRLALKDGIKGWHRRIVNDRMTKKQKQEALDSIESLHVGITEIECYFKAKGVSYD